jgi:hypothetical protein
MGYQLYIDLKKVYDSAEQKPTNITIVFSITIKRVKLNKICLEETYPKVRTVEHFCDSLVFRMA